MDRCCFFFAGEVDALDEHLLVFERCFVCYGLLLMDSKRWLHDLADLLILLWNKTGTVSAIVLMASGVGMAIYYTKSPEAAARNYETYEGFFNHAGTELPEGLDAIPHERTETVKSQVRFEYDSDGKLHRVYHVNEHGETTTIPGSKIAEQQLSYDGKGRLIKKTNLDAYGQPSTDSVGVYERHFEYNDFGNLTRTSFYDANGKLVMPYVPGFAIEVIRYDGAQRIVAIEHFDANGEHVANNQGYSEVDIVYEGNTMTRRYMHKGELVKNAHGYAIEKKQVSNEGRIERTTWYDEYEKPCINHELGCAGMQHEYTHDHQARRVLYLNHEGKQMADSPDISEHIERLTDHGKPRWECFLSSDGLPHLDEELGYAECAYEYDGKKRVSREHLRDALGKLAHCYERRYHYSPEGDRILSLYRDGSTSTRVLKEAP